MPSARGFTLIELIVVISIIAILSGLTFAQFRTLREDQNLNSAALDLQTFIRLAQSNAVSGVICNNTPNGTFQWYLAFLNSTSVAIYCTYDNDNDPATVPVSSPQFRLLTLSNNVSISQVTGDSGACNIGFDATPPLDTAIKYDVPFGQVTLSDTNNQACVTSSNTFNIVLRNSNNTRSKTVTVARGGSIEISASTSSSGGSSPAPSSSPASSPPPPSPSVLPSPLPSSGPVDADSDGFQAGAVGTTCPNGQPCDCYDKNPTVRPNPPANDYHPDTRGTSALGNDAAGNTWNSFDWNCANGVEFEYPNYCSGSLLNQQHTYYGDNHPNCPAVTTEVKSDRVCSVSPSNTVIADCGQARQRKFTDTSYNDGGGCVNVSIFVSPEIMRCR